MNYVFLLMGKRGISHLEAIISFVFFIGFLIFAFVFFNPFQSNRTLDSSLEYANIEIRDFIQRDVAIYSIVITSTADPAVIYIQDVPANSVASVEDSGGTIIPSFTDANGVHFNRNGGNFFRIKYSEVFTNGNEISGTLLNEGTDYKISSSSKRKIISEIKLLELNSSYEINYDALKAQFNLPNRVDFGFSAVLSDGIEIKSSREVPDNLEVFGKSDRIEIIRAGGEIEFADFVVNVW